MATVTTTLSAAMTAGSPLISVTALTSVTAGMYARIDGEFVGPVPNPVPSVTQFVIPRGQLGTVAAAHASGANVTFGLTSDFDSPPAGSSSAYAQQPAVTTTSYSASGAITLPAGSSTAIAILNGTTALAMTVAAPGKHQDGATLTISSNGAANHTVTFTGGLSLAGTSYDVWTINASKPASITVTASNGAWQCPNAPPMGGTVTNLIGSIA